MDNLPVTDLGKIHDNLGVGLIISKPKIFFSNEEAKKIFGFDPVGKTISELFGNDLVWSDSEYDELNFEQLIGNEWRIISARKISDYTIALIKTDRERNIANKDIQKSSVEFISSLRSSVSVINLLADRIARNTPENSESVAQIRHNCCKLLKDIGSVQTLHSNISESPMFSQISISELLSEIVSSASPFLEIIGISLEYEKPAFSCVVSIFEQDAERLVYGLLNTFAYFISSQDKKESTVKIRIYFRISGNDVFLHLVSDCSNLSVNYTAINSTKFDELSSSMPIGFHKNLNVIRHIVKKYGLNIVYSIEEKDRRSSIITKFVLDDTVTESFLSQCNERSQKLALWSSLIEFSDFLPANLYNKLT